MRSRSCWMCRGTFPHNLLSCMVVGGCIVVMIDGHTHQTGFCFILELQPNLGLPSRGLSISQEIPVSVVGGTDSRGSRIRRACERLPLQSLCPPTESRHRTPCNLTNGQPIPHQFGHCTHPSVGLIAVMLWQETGHTLLLVALTTRRYVRDAQFAIGHWTRRTFPRQSQHIREAPEFSIKALPSLFPFRSPSLFLRTFFVLLTGEHTYHTLEETRNADEMRTTERLRSCLKLSSTPNLCQHRLALPLPETFRHTHLRRPLFPRFYFLTLFPTATALPSYAGVFFRNPPHIRCPALFFQETR